VWGGGGGGWGGVMHPFVIFGTCLCKRLIRAVSYFNRRPYLGLQHYTHGKLQSPVCSAPSTKITCYTYVSMIPKIKLYVTGFWKIGHYLSHVK